MVHGHRRAFVTAGEGPPLLLLHGIGNSAQTWAPVLDRLARSHTVIAPDLLGHGSSDKPRGDYSLGGYANGMRDLLSVLDIERATVVGHSLGGGIALQFAYQYPERCSRLALVAAGGLGRGLNPVLRLATLPGAEPVLTLLTLSVGPAVEPLLLRAIGVLAELVGSREAQDLAFALDALAGLTDVAARRAFLRTLRSVADIRGQVVTALDRLHLAAAMPMLAVWGTRDPIIPMEHADALRRAAPDARLEIFEGAGHWPHLSDPERFCDVLLEFCRDTKPAEHDRDSWRLLLAQGRGESALSPDPERRRSSLP
jgi:pimeloyl-ACP methyl ester carboxylesterase